MRTQTADVVAIAKDLIRCESVTPNEGGALQVLQDLLEPAGFRVHRMTFSAPGTPDVENLYARIGTSAPNLCFAGHTDVVPPGDRAAWSVPPFAGDVRDGVLYGRGAVDMKGAVAAFVAAALDHVANNAGRPAHGSISLLITGDEEGPAINGTAKVLDWLSEQGEKLDGCIVGEPTNPTTLGDEIKIGRRGSLNGKVRVYGRQGHVAYPHIALNPVPALARIVDRLSAERFDGGTEHFAPTNLEVCVLGTSSTATNVIPAEATAELNIRYNTHWSRETLEARIRELCAAAVTDLNQQVHIEVEFSGTGGVFVTEPGAFVEKVKACVIDVTGRTPALTTSGGTSDARFIHAHCPVVEFGLVNATIHAVDERTPVSDLEMLKAVYQRILEER